MDTTDFDDPDFDAEDWAQSFEDAPSIGEVLHSLFDRPSQTTIEEGVSHTTVVFTGQEFDAIQALAQRLRELE